MHPSLGTQGEGETAVTVRDAEVEDAAIWDDLWLALLNRWMGEAG